MTHVGNPVDYLMRPVELEIRTPRIKLRPKGRQRENGDAASRDADRQPAAVLVDDLRELFGTFHALTRPKGKVLASVLSPCFIGDMRSRLWWRGAPRLWRDGQLFLPGPQAPYYRRLLRTFRTVSAPHFSLSRVFRGMPPSRAEHSSGIDPQRDFAWLHIARCRYMFLLFERTA